MGLCPSGFFLSGVMSEWGFFPVGICPGGFFSSEVMAYYGIYGLQYIISNNMEVLVFDIYWAKVIGIFHFKNPYHIKMMNLS